MTESMQMDLNLYMGFPWSCEHARFEGATADAYDDQYAFWCDAMVTIELPDGKTCQTAYRGYRMVEEECLGMECPCCKVRKAEDIARMMSAYGRRPE